MTDTPRHLEGLTGVAHKNLAHERDLEELNALLAPVEETLRAPHATPQRPIVFVLGAPRSGTTLVSQLLTATGQFGTISNFTARFWQAPALALTIERTLRLAHQSGDFRSVRGITTAPSDPHEFGYFWSSWFDLGQPTHALSAEDQARIDASGLRRALAAMEQAAGRPLAFKNNTWFTFQARWLAQALPKAVFVACRRDPFFVAQSLYEQRLALHGDPATWWSVRPNAHARLAALEPLAQVAAQAVEIQRDMEKSLATIAPDRLIRADYARVCENPHDVLSEIGEACTKAGEPMALALQGLPRQFRSTDTVRLAANTAEALRAHVAAWIAAG